MPGRQLEEFLVESWIEHLRQIERYTAVDKTSRAEFLLYTQECGTLAGDSLYGGGTRVISMTMTCT